APVGKQGGQGRQRGQADGDVHVEDPVPGDVVREPPTDEWADKEAEAEHSSEETHVATPLARGEEIADGGHGHGHERASTQALEGAEGYELVHGLGEAWKPGTDEEQADADQEHGLAAVDVGEFALDGDGDR